MTLRAVPALEVRDLTLRFGSVTAFADLSFDVARGELFAVIGPNGAGKTSLFNVLSRAYVPTAGSVRFEGADLLRLRISALAGAGVARTFQNLGLFGQLTALENVLIGRHHLMRSGPLRSGLWLGYARREERRHRAAAIDALEFAGIGRHAHAPVGALPFGIQKRVEIARALAMEPRLMLLDEPVAGMSVTEREEITALVRRLHDECDLTVLLVEHDMGMVMRIAQRVLVLDFGQIIAIGTPTEVQRDERVIRAYLGEEIEPGQAERSPEATGGLAGVRQ
jgi:branched-chain amino acid transport system ATP-binding protein